MSIIAAGIVNKVPARDTAAPSPQLLPFCSTPFGEMLGVASSARLTLEDKVIILLGAAHVAPAASCSHRAALGFPPCRCQASSRRRRGGPGSRRRRGTRRSHQRFLSTGERAAPKGSRGSAEGLGQRRRETPSWRRRDRLSQGVGLGVAAQVGQVVSPLGQSRAGWRRSQGLILSAGRAGAARRASTLWARWARRGALVSRAAMANWGSVWCHGSKGRWGLHGHCGVGWQRGQLCQQQNLHSVRLPPL